MTKSIKRLLAIGALSLVIPLFGVAQPRDNNGGGCSEGNGRHGKKCQAVPDSGSTASLFLLVGATCAGAMLVRSRFTSRRLA